MVLPDRLWCGQTPVVIQCNPLRPHLYHIQSLSSEVGRLQASVAVDLARQDLRIRKIKNGVQEITVMRG